MNPPDLEALIQEVRRNAERLDRISAQLAAIDAQLYRMRTQPKGTL